MPGEIWEITVGWWSLARANRMGQVSLTSRGEDMPQVIGGGGMGGGPHSGSDQGLEFKDHPSADLHKHTDSPSLTL